ncbi:MAG TPA: recombinase family protein [Planctomycetota bacterium]|nr:recombinase family protein [Planctomycetota bacterium]
MNTEKDQRRAVIYARVSVSEQANTEFCSLDGQEARCRDLRRAKDWEIVGSLKDVSTGSNTDRHQLQKLLADAEKGRFDVVLVYKLDRLSRSVLDFRMVINALQRDGVDLVSVTESFDTSTSAGRLMMNLLASFAEFARADRRAHEAGVVLARCRRMVAGAMDSLRLRPCPEQ